jgi:hypothetical protein
MVRRLLSLGMGVIAVLVLGMALFFAPSIATAFTLVQRLSTPTTPQDSGFFVDTEQALATGALDVQPADFNGDGGLDLIFDSSEHGGEVWLNQLGTLTFTPTGQTLGAFSIQSMAVGDIDGDEDIDVLVGSDNLGANAQIKVWTNDGTGMFTATGHLIGATLPGAIALGDLDGDEDVDVFVARVANLPNQVWLNNGSGQFTNSGQALGAAHSTDVALGDLDGDEDLDAFVVDSNVNTVWFNNGSGQFTDSGQQLAAATGLGVALGDIDRDGDIDAATANQESTNRLWQNNGNGSFTQLPLPESGTNSQNVTFTDVDVDGDLDLFVSRAELNLVFFNMGGVQMGTMGTYANSFQLLLNTSYTYATVLHDFDGDHDPDAITGEGVTSRVWRNDGLSSLGVFYRIRDDVLGQTERGQHYSALYYNHTGELTAQMIKNPSLAVEGYETVTLWKPNLETLLTENRGDAIITQEQVDAFDDFLTTLSAVASPQLQQVIAEERAALPPFDTFVGQTMSAATLSILGSPTFTEQTYLPLIQKDSATRFATDITSVRGGCDCGVAWLLRQIMESTGGPPNSCNDR